MSANQGGPEAQLFADGVGGLSDLAANEPQREWEGLVVGAGVPYEKAVVGGEGRFTKRPPRIFVLSAGAS